MFAPSRSSAWILWPLLAGLSHASRVEAQALRLDPHRTTAGFTVDATMRGNDPGASSGATALTEWFIAPFTGALIDPRIFGYTLELRPRFTQQYATELPASLRSRDIGVGATASLFRALPVALDVTYNRSSGTRSGGFGSRGEFGNSALFSVLRFDNVYLPMHLSYTARSRRNLAEVGANFTPVKTSDALQSVRFTARNSKLDANLVWTDQDDRLGENDFSLRDFDIAHRLRWGKGSTLRSRAEWSSRTGSAPYDRQSWDERLRILHTRSTSTTWSFDRFNSNGNENRVSGTGLGWHLDSRALSWLSFGATVSRRTSETTTGTQSFFNAGPRLALRISPATDVTLTGNASVLAVHRTIDGSLNGALQVLNEEHRVDETFFIVLGQPRVDETSVVVRSEDQTIVYRDGIDYSLTIIGESTEVRVLPGSRIEEDDVVLITYLYEPDLALEERGIRRSFGGGAAFRGLSLRYDRTERSADFTGQGDLPTSGDFVDDATVLSFRGLTPLGRLRATAKHRSRESATIDYVTDEANLVLGIPIGRRVQIFLDGAARRVEDEDDEVRVLTAGASSAWSVGGFSLDAGFRLQDWKQRRGLDELDLSARLGLRWRVRLTDIHVRMTSDRRMLEGGSTTGLAVRMDLTRRF